MTKYSKKELLAMGRREVVELLPDTLRGQALDIYDKAVTRAVNDGFDLLSSTPAAPRYISNLRSLVIDIWAGAFFFLKDGNEEILLSVVKNKDLNKKKYNQIELPNQCLEEVPHHANKALFYTHVERNENVETGIMWDYKGNAPSSWAAAYPSLAAPRWLTLGYTKAEASLELYLTKAAAYQRAKEDKFKNWTSEELNGLEMFRLRSIAHCRRISKPYTKQRKKLVGDILTDQVSISLFAV